MGLIKTIKENLYAEKIDGVIMRCGHMRDEPDDRDFQVGLFGFGDYTPLHQRLVLPTVSIKNQGSRNTCGWNSVTVQKENDEKGELSQRTLVIYANEQNLLTADGLSSTRNNQKAVHDFGIAERSFLDEVDAPWSVYADSAALTDRARVNASNHKSQSYWVVNGRNDTLKLLDQGRILATGSDWYAGYNMRGGFSAPWLITKEVGALVGGHAFVMIGYDLNYQGRKVYIFQNSYGKDWGDDGKFYWDMDHFDKVGYSRYAQLDIPVDTANFLNQFNSFNVKANDPKQPAIFFIRDGKKSPYPNWLTFEAYGGTKNGFELVDPKVLAAVQTGTEMDITVSPVWHIIKDAAAPANAIIIQNILANKNVKIGYNPQAKEWEVAGLPENLQDHLTLN